MKINELKKLAKEIGQKKIIKMIESTIEKDAIPADVKKHVQGVLKHFKSDSFKQADAGGS